MSTIVLRSVKGLPLTNAEVDANFSNLNTDKTELGGTYSSGTANGVLFLSSSKVLTTGSALTFDGSYFTAASGTGSFLADILQVSGTATKVNANGVGLEFRGSATPNITAYNRTTSAYLPMTLDTSASIFSISGSEQMRLTSTGLGIGTSSPAYKLDVTGTAAISGAVTLSGGTANGVAYLNGSKVLTTGSALTFDGTNLGVGSAMESGYGRLQVRNGFAYINEDGSNTRQLYLRSGFGGTLPAMQVVGGDLGFVLGSTEQMRLTSTGLGIGTSSPGDKLEIGGAGAGIILASPNGTRYRLTVNNLGVLTIAAV